MIPQISNIIRIVIQSVKDKINRKNRENCFGIFGFDFLLDINFKIWLIEVNKNSGLSYSSNLLKTLLPRMINDCLKLTIDDIFQQNKSPEQSFPVEGYDNNSILW